MGRHKYTSCQVCYASTHYAKGMCKPCYMEANRNTFSKYPANRAKAVPIDPEDFWQFVKKELKIG